MLLCRLQMCAIGAYAARASQNLVISEQCSLDYRTQHVLLLLPQRAVIAALLIGFVSDTYNRIPN